MLDFDGKRHEMALDDLNLFIFYQLSTQNILCIIISFISSPVACILFNFTSCSINIAGAYYMLNKESNSIKEVLIDNDKMGSFV
jgi:hypothetical protein